MPAVNRAFISLQVYDYANSGYGRMELKCFFSCSAWRENKYSDCMAHSSRKAKKLGSALTVADHRLPGQLLNLDTDTGKLMFLL